MKKIIPAIIATTAATAVLFSGCRLFSTDIVTGETGEATIASQGSEAESETAIITVNVTDANGENVVNENGELETETQVVVVVPSTTQAGQVSPAVTDSANSNNPTSGNSGEVTTAAGGSSVQTPVTQPSSSSGSGTVTVPTGTTEYDVLRSGNFYMVGNMTTSDGTVPLDLAITPKTLYMTSSMDGLNVGLLIDANKKLYMMIDDKKIYLEMSESVCKYLGMDVDELISSGAYDFSKYPELSKANSVNNVSLNGVACTEYVFNNTDGSSTRVYLNGTKLLRFAEFDSTGKVTSSSDVTSISATVPASKVAPPADYKGYSGVAGVIGFMGQCADLIE